jgi:hypothetical protein
MVKRRAPSSEAVKAFASKADTPPVQVKVNVQSPPELQPDAPRDYKSIRLPLNQYEYEKLCELCKATQRGKLNAIRWAIIDAAERETAL